MPRKKQSAKRKHNPKSTANLEPGKHQQGLKKGGSKGRARDFLTEQEIDFCQSMAAHGVIKWACEDAHMALRTGGALNRRPLAIAKINAIAAHYAAKTGERDMVRREKERELAHRELLRRVPFMKTHSKRGDEAWVKAVIGIRNHNQPQPRTISVSQQMAVASLAANSAGMKVIIEHIGRPQDQIAAKAVFAGRPLE